MDRVLLENGLEGLLSDHGWTAVLRALTRLAFEAASDAEVAARAADEANRVRLEEAAGRWWRFDGALQDASEQSESL
jgi:hypothetical protein